jgi:glycosyltransferase involved in cell wall biosynthesis
MRVAIVHDKLMQFGGAERVVLALRRIWPDADLYTSVYDRGLARRLGLEPVRPTYLQRLPAAEDHAHRFFLPLYDGAFRRLRLDDYDVVISSSAMWAKSVRTPPDTPHVCYCHTPIRYLWEDSSSHVAELPYPAPIRAGVAAIVPLLRRADLRAARGVDVFVANSTHVAGLIERYYGREAEVIHPPVDVGGYRADLGRGDYLLIVARLFPYKRVDVAIETCGRLGVPLKVVGDGSDRPRLEALAGPQVEFLGWVEESEKPKLFGEARALIAPQVEDFGIVMVEALAAGTPVVALAAGGALDIVEDGETGVLFEGQNAESLTAAIARSDEIDWDRAGLRAAAGRFSEERFASAMRGCVEAAAQRPASAAA